MSKIIVSFLAVHILSSPRLIHISFSFCFLNGPFFGGYAAFFFTYINITIFYNDNLTRKVDLLVHFPRVKHFVNYLL